MMDLRYLLFPVSGALTGWLTGWILSRIIMDFVINQRRAALSGQLARFISSRIISPDLVLEKIAKPENFLKLMPVIEHHIDDFLRNRLKTAIPMIGMMIGERTISQLKTVFMQELEVIFPEVLNKYLNDLADSFDFNAALEQKLVDIPAEKIRPVLYPVTKKFFCLAGALSGFIAALVNLGILYLLRL